MDDVWGDDEFNFKPNSEEKYGASDESHINVNALRQQHAKRGYLDGVSQSKEETIQRGFDEGFNTGLNIGDKVGYILGVLQFYKAVSGDSSQYDKAVAELQIADVLKSSYFDEKLDQFDNPTVAKWLDYCENIDLK